MKTRILTFFFCLAAVTGMAQVQAPAPSPFCKITQTVGLTDITVEYSRPGVKDREIFGDLVPYDKMWRTGANKNTIVNFQHDVKIGGKDLKAGSYALFAKPGERSWEIYFYSETENWGVPEDWNESKVALSTTVRSEKHEPSLETFMISFDELTNNDAVMNLTWANTQVGIQIVVPSEQMTMESIDQALSGPGFRDYYSAAKYYRQEGKQLNQALDWINAAIKAGGGDKYFVLREKALIHAEMGDYDAAIQAAKESNKSAEAAGSDGYVKMNNASIAEWKQK